MLKTKQKAELWKYFKEHGANALKASHYELALLTPETNPAVWKEFLMEPDVNEYISQETAVLQEAEFRKILLNTERDNSAGRAQLINAMMNVSNKQNKKEGPIVIYSYIPLNEQQMKASNIQLNDKDPFKQ